MVEGILAVKTHLASKKSVTISPLTTCLPNLIPTNTLATSTYLSSTDVLSSDGDLKCLVYFRFLDSLNGKPSSSQGPHKIVPRETDTIAFPLKK
jgi:hypothetical protein